MYLPLELVLQRVMVIMSRRRAVALLAHATGGAAVDEHHASDERERGRHQPGSGDEERLEPQRGRRQPPRPWRAWLPCPPPLVAPQERQVHRLRGLGLLHLPP